MLLCGSSVCTSIILTFSTVNAPFELANAPFQDVNKREKMFAVCARMQMPVTINVLIRHNLSCSVDRMSHIPFFVSF